MILLKQINEETRIIAKRWYWKAILSPTINLQRYHYFWGWKTSSWNYIDVIGHKDKDYIEEWLLWDEDRSMQEKSIDKIKNTFNI